MKKDHFRTPVLNTFRRKSPFEQLLKHMGKVNECVDILGNGLLRYYKGDYKSFSEIAENVSKLEYEADVIAHEVLKKMFQMEEELDPITVMLCMKIFGALGKLANHAENCGDNLRNLIICR